MKVLVTGAGGQLGRALTEAAPTWAHIVPCDRARLDVTDRAAVSAMLAAELPGLVVNAAAYTAVDRAESEEALAFAVNAAAVGHLAEAAREGGTAFVHISTDFVFDGKSSSPYPPDAPTHPLGVYGRSKRAGEEAAGADALIVRTAWLYTAGGANFVATMLGKFDAGQDVRVVADQIGTPTFALDLAGAIWTLAERGARGLFHYTDAGTASWYDLAVAIQEEAIAAGLVRQPVRITPIATGDYPTAARRPAYSVLDKTACYRALGEPAPHWRVSLRTMIGQLARQAGGPART